MARRAWEQEIEPWFLRNGLPYFVPTERERARQALRPRKAVPLMVLVALVAVAAAGALTWATGEKSFAPATLSLIAVLAATFYAVTALRARPILAWALRRTRRSLRQLLPMVTRALPLLLLFITFLFINAEVWQLSATLDGSVLWLTLLLFGTIAIGFLLVRLPEEVDKVDDFIDVDMIRRATRTTPIEEPVAELLDREHDQVLLQQYGDVPGFERWNLILVLLVTQVAQVLLLAMAVFGFFLVFGGIVMTEGVQQAWTAQEDVANLPYVDNLSVELVQVATFLAAFSGLYFAVAVMTDENYRVQFFSEVLHELEQAVGVRAGYLALRDDTGAASDTAPDPGA
jgi:intracellular septation protein A